MSLTLRTSPQHSHQPSDSEHHPKTIEEAVLTLDGMLNEETKLFLSAIKTESAVSELHHTLGRYLRNKWCLWSGSSLARHLKEVHGIDHPDDMSHFIIMAYCKNIAK
jgi:hypothetical protein